jgi:hypothetical protein
VLKVDDRGRAWGKLKVTNNLAVAQEIVLDSSRAYVQVEPRKLICKPGKTRRFIVRLLFMPGPRLRDPRALSIQTEEITETVGIEAA